MNARQAMFGLVLVGARVASACELPSLVAIPGAGDLGDDAAQLVVRVQRYVTDTQAYTDCVKAELAAAGGDGAPDSLRKQLTVRNNNAVAEARAVLAVFGERVAPQEDLYLAAFITGDGADCIPTSRLEGTSVINDVAVLFLETDAQGYLSVLEESCRDLERYGDFDVRSRSVGDFADIGGPAPSVPNRTGRLCSNEFIAPYAFEAGDLRGRQCALGRFYELTKEQVARLMELRAAARPAAAEPPAANDRSEETRESQRRAR